MDNEQLGLTDSSGKGLNGRVAEWMKSPAERAHNIKWRKALAIREANFEKSDFEEEDARLEIEIAEKLAELGMEPVIFDQSKIHKGRAIPYDGYFE